MTSSFNNIKKVYFLGIGGIGMSALARYFNHEGLPVSGYDHVESVLTRKLTEEGISIHYNDCPESLNQLNKDQTLVVYTPAIPKDLKERIYLEENGFNLKKRSEVLGMISEKLKTCAVSGTHGKTTVSTMLAHIFKNSELDCTAFLGGVSKNYGTNFLTSSTSKWMVAEADEFDRSFLHLSPEIALVTAMDADHLDIYGTKSVLIEAFNQFLSQVKPGGKMIVKKGLPVRESSCKQGTLYSYALDDNDADFYAENIISQKESYCFDLVYPNGKIKGIHLNYPGLIYVENAVAASSMALLAGIDESSIVKALSTYKGVNRRFDIRLHNSDYILIDDYAHHPGEIKATVYSVRKMYPGQRITGIFQPHLYSRTADFAEGFAKELSNLDEVILLDIYPAREKPIPGVSSKIIYDRLSCKEKTLITKEELLKRAETLKPGIILMMGAGDIDLLVEPIEKLLCRKTND